MRYEARYTPSVEDFLTGVHMQNQRRDNDNRKLCLYIGIGVAIVFGIAACILHALALCIAGIFIGIFMPVALPIIRWPMELAIRIEDNIRRRSKKFKQEELKFYLTEDGIEFFNGVAQSNYTWDVFAKSLLDERGVLLFLDSQSYFFIPAAAFIGGHFPLQELKSLLTSKKN
jgi:hypothetical protein